MPSTFEALESRNPHNGEVIGSYDQHDDGEVDRCLDTVIGAQSRWAKVDVVERSRYLADLAGVLRVRRAEYARLMTQEMGKPVVQAEGEVEKCAWLCEYYAEYSARFLEAAPVDTDAARSEVVFRPLGTVFAIMPWNFPFWQAFRFAAPALAAGNGVVLKHAGNVTGCGLAIEAICAEALPENLLRTIVMESARAASVIEDPRIAAVTFTGSTGAGRKVGAAAGGALKKIRAGTRWQ
ncbi:MAG: aldehyde dehydrogenase family protein [Gammaproteobacteria bacterium]|nr:aldehyde dehydrogenase family protein [Gammaproteobacteria bacterium]